jgi:hypothetical protein
MLHDSRTVQGRLRAVKCECAVYGLGVGVLKGDTLVVKIKFFGWLGGSHVVSRCSKGVRISLIGAAQ